MSEAPKALLKANTAEAVELGVYGSPALLVDRTYQGSSAGVDTAIRGEGGMLIFGSDRFEQLAFLCDKPWFGPDPGPCSPQVADDSTSRNMQPKL